MNYLKKSNHGITLVALVITIIVLLVLATIVTKVAIDSGPLKTARRANDSYIIKSEKAEITIGYHNYQEAKDVNKSETLKVKSPSLKDDGQDGPTAEGVLAHVGGDETSGWTIHFTDTKNTYYLDGNGNIDGPHPNGEDPGATEETNPTTGGGGTTDPEDDPTPTEEPEQPEQPTDTTWKDNGDGTFTKNGVTIAIGDYVDYTYDTASAYSLSKTYNGYNSNQTISQTQNLKWRILNVDTDTGKIDLVSEKEAGNTVNLQGALGYNNGVYFVNDICKKHYSKSAWGIQARSINIEDIEKQMTTAGIQARDNYEPAMGNVASGNDSTDTGKYGGRFTQAKTSGYYPTLYEQEKGNGVNSYSISTTGKSASDPVYSKPTTETYKKTTEYVMSIQLTMYEMNGNNLSTYFKNNTDKILFSGANCWIGSRIVTTGSTFGTTLIFFGMHTLTSTGISGEGMFQTGNTQANSGACLRPVVTLDSNVIIGSTGGTSSNPRSLTKT